MNHSVANAIRLAAWALACPLILPAGIVAAAETTTLPRIKVEETPDNATTEGTGSYTTNSTSTSTGLNLSLRETPQSVSVITRQRIEDQNLRSLTDVVSNTTGISASLYDSTRYGYSARGFSIDKILTDGVFMAWDIAFAAGEAQTDMALYDRVEVVRGATGLTTGSGEPSAAINLIRKHADSETLAGSVDLALGSWNDYSGTVDVATPLNASGSVRARVVGSYQDQEYYIDLDERRKKTLYGVLDADLAERTRLSVGASRQANRPDGTMWGGLPPWTSDGARIEWARSKTTAADWAYWRSTAENYFATLDHRFANDWQIKVSLNRNAAGSDMKLNYLYGSPDRETGEGMGAFLVRYDGTREQDAANVDATGGFELLGRRHELSFGFSHSEQDFTMDQQGAVDTAAVGNFFAWNGASYPEPEWTRPALWDSYQTRETGIYAAARFSVTDELKLIAGNRWDKWERHDRMAGRNYGGDGVNIPYFGLVHDFGDRFSAFASYSEIFKEQSEKNRDGDFLEPVTGANYEAGIKGEFHDGRVNAFLTVFHIEQDNLAQRDGALTVPGNSLEQAYFGAQGTQTDGYELEVAGEVTPGWQLSAGWTRFDADDADGVEINTFHPHQMLKVFSLYRFTERVPGLRIGGGVNWQGRNYTRSENPVTGTPERLEQGAYALAELMASYEWSRALSTQLNVNNLFDKRYYSQIGQYSQLAYGAPRNASLTFRYAF